MSAKKKKRPGAAQQLIDELLDEKTPAPNSNFESTDSFQLGEKPRAKAQLETEATRIPPSFDSQPVTLDLDDEPSHSLSIDKSVNRSANHSAAPKLTEQTSTAEFAVSAAKPVSPQEHEAEKTMQIDSVKKKPALETATNQSRTEVMKASRGAQERVIDRANEPSKVDRGGVTELKTVVKMRDRSGVEFGDKSSLRQPGGSSNAFTSPEAALKQSENLRIAQARISELDHELERLRRENESLATAGDTLSRRTDELVSKCEQLEMNSKESKELHEEEKKYFRTQVQAKDRENAELRARLEEMEGRLESNFKKIRVRERELEHRLEIVRMESSTLVANKDKMLLDLKRQIDQLTHENEYAKQKSQELFNQFKGKQETIVRVVRALRMALDYLEGADDSNKKE